MDWDSLRNQFRAKKSVLSVHVVKPGENVIESSNNGTSEVLGEADFDLAYYANNSHVTTDKLPLRNCSIDDGAYIEIYIKTNAEEILKQA